MKNILYSFIKRDNQQAGIVVIILSLLMILSLLLLPFKVNPLYLIQSFTIIILIGEVQTLLIWIFIILFAAIYYMGIKIPALTIKRTIGIIGITFASYWFINNWVIVGSHSDYIIQEQNMFIAFYNYIFINHIGDILSSKTSWVTGQWFINEGWFINMGFLLPLLFFVTTTWCYGIIGGFIFGAIIIYCIYIIWFNEYQIYLAKLQFWKNEDKNIWIQKEVEAIDLNVETQEFELNFTIEEKEKIDLIQRVKKNMDTKNYEELSAKIQAEKEKMQSLKEKILIKAKKIKEENNNNSVLTKKGKEELMLTLGQISYSKIKTQSNKIEDIKIKESLSTEPKSNLEEKLLKEGYKTVETVLNLEEKDLSDSFIEELTSELYKNFDPTQEINLMQKYYSDIFEKDEKYEEEINKTLETTLSTTEITGEIIIENLKEEITVEQYLSIPDDISSIEEKTQEGIISIIETITSKEEIKSKYKTEETINELEETIWYDEEKKFQDKQKEIVVEKTKIKDEIEEIISEPKETIWYDEEKTVDEIVKEEVKIRPLNWCKPYVLPSTSILSPTINNFDHPKLVEELNIKSTKLNDVFSSFNIDANVNSFDIGPTISTFKIEIQSGIKTTKVTNLEDNIKLVLGAEYIRIIAPIPGTSFIGIEVPNSIKKPVLFKTVFDQTELENGGIQISIGQDVSGKSLAFDLTKAPHLLVAGSTGSGKSVAINTILASIIFRYKPTDVQLILIDPKMVEFAPFRGIPHLLSEVITDATNANNALKAMVDEMESRYKTMAENGVKKLDELNNKLISEGKNKLPYIVIIIDELADLMMVAAKEVEDSIMRITQKARAAGIHMIVATQRPSTEIITGTIKSNIPSRIAFTVASSIDSRTILGQIGAEKLIGMGDMLISLYGKLPVRGQGAYISNNEIEELAGFAKTQCDAFYTIDVEKFANSLNSINQGLISLNDPIYIAAKDTVLHYQKASTSMLQRHLNIGYNKAANIIETLESEGIIGKAKGSRPRKVLKEV